MITEIATVLFPKKAGIFVPSLELQVGLVLIPPPDLTRLKFLV